MKVKLAYKSMTMCHKQQPPLFRRSRKGLKMTSAQLLAKKPRFELTLKLTVFKGPCRLLSSQVS